MTKLENKSLRFIKINRGIAIDKLTLMLDKDISSVRKALKKLHHLGYVSYWKGGIYPNFRSLEIFEKGKDSLYDEIELKNHLTPKQIAKYIKCSERDYWYCCNYLIDEENKVLFEKTNGVVFDLGRFEYFLCYSLDNRDGLGGWV